MLYFVVNSLEIHSKIINKTLFANKNTQKGNCYPSKLSLKVFLIGGCIGYCCTHSYSFAISSARCICWICSRNMGGSGVCNWNFWTSFHDSLKIWKVFIKIANCSVRNSLVLLCKEEVTYHSLIWFMKRLQLAVNKISCYRLAKYLSEDIIAAQFSAPCNTCVFLRFALNCCLCNAPNYSTISFICECPWNRFQLNHCWIVVAFDHVQSIVWTAK